MTAAALVCGSCGAELPPNSKFCNECGAALMPAAKPAEYKQVTVLFADIVRSMDIAGAVDIERLREIMTAVVERSAAVVRRYGGGTVEYTGDGVMAIFGAPVALEDHAFRGCLAALAIQEEARRLATEVQRRDGVTVRLRVGLNSGRVIAGSTTRGYTATGEPVGFAQRIESAAPPGGVMLSESTARLVEHTVLLDAPEWVHIKGADKPVRAHRLLAIAPRDALAARSEASLVGRRWEMAVLDAMVDRAIGSHGGVVTVVGPPGIGKSRTARETAGCAAGRNVEVFWTFCEAHASDIPFRVVAHLLRVRTGIADLDGEAARARVRKQFPDADPQDLLLLDDLVGIADPDVPPPQIEPDARRRRLIALINTAALATAEPSLFIVEDAQWIDAVSESMLADFLSVIPQTRSMVLITARPEYAGVLTRVPGAQTISLAPLGDSDTEALIGELLGPDRSVTELAATLAERAAGNPFFAEEMVRELAQRGVLAGEHGNYVRAANTAEVTVPPTVQATIEARIDRLNTPAKRTLHAAAVIGVRFEADLLAALGIDAVLDELLGAELVDQVRFTPSAEYAFRHPLIRAVAYESQLKSDRAQWHRRLAAAIQEREPGSVEENAALIADHLQAADEVHAAYEWHMRAGAWSTNRDLEAARGSWERARRIADALPPDDPHRLPMRIAPRTMLCATDSQEGVGESRSRFAELRELCSAAGDKVSLAIGMTGPLAELLYAERAREASRLASEQMALLESIGDPTLTIGSAHAAFATWADAGDFDEILQWSQTVIDLAAGDAAKGAGFGFGSPLAVALAWRSTARWWLGRPGWRQDLHDAVAMGRRSNHATTFGGVLIWSYGYAIHFGAVRADDSAVRASEAALQTAERTGNDLAVSMAKYTLGVALLSRDTAAERHRGMELMMQARAIWVHKQIALQMLPVTDLWAAREGAAGDRDAAIAVMRQAVDGMYEDGRLGWGVWGTGILLQTLLDRGADGDLTEAEAVIERLAVASAADGRAMPDIWLLRLRALLARARGDDAAYTNFRDLYRDAAKSLGFEGHIAWAGALP
ncbi:AAA family ATPase [Mycobacterium conspicuum]|nr:adenylate/guanylate cyclase domain-containing protein [Mycobacterium conspicuum]ORV33383.1 cyclase [Mycobacterium conspicuum]